MAVELWHRNSSLNCIIINTEFMFSDTFELRCVTQFLPIPSWLGNLFHMAADSVHLQSSPAQNNNHTRTHDTCRSGFFTHGDISCQLFDKAASDPPQVASHTSLVDISLCFPLLQLFSLVEHLILHFELSPLRHLHIRLDVPREAPPH